MDKSRKRKLEITTEENTDEERLQLLRKLDRAVAKGKATRESSLRTRLAALDASKRESPRVFSKPIQKAVDGEIISLCQSDNAAACDFVGFHRVHIFCLVRRRRHCLRRDQDAQPLGIRQQILCGNLAPVSTRYRLDARPRS
ncbi:MAG: hypothetical protein EBZ48_18190 [Proteobacteria bacterium]|nr:hypothetical protein [Pseudomonadota bacterium]